MTWENITLNDLDIVIGGIGQGEKWRVSEDGDCITLNGKELEDAIDYYDMLEKYGTRKVVLMEINNHDIFLREEN